MRRDLANLQPAHGPRRPQHGAAALPTRGSPASTLTRDEWLDHFVGTLRPFLAPSCAVQGRAIERLWLRFGHRDPTEFALDVLES
jgi:hypothetical protein